MSGFGMCAQRAGAEIGAGPDLYTACQVLIIHPDTARQFAKPVCAGPACQVPNHTGMHCLPSSNCGFQCPARQVENTGKQDVDGWSRQPLSGVLTVQIHVGIFVSVLKMDLW